MSDQRRELVRARELQGLTQADAAERLYVATSTWARWERGERAPRTQHIAEIARVLDVPAARVRSWFASPDEPDEASGRAVPEAERPLPDLGDPIMIFADARSLGASNADPEVLRIARMSLGRIVDRYEELGPWTLAPEARELRRSLHALLRGQQPPRQRRELFATAARAAGLLGYMAVHLGRPVVAEAYLAEAELLAGHAEDVEMRMWAGGTRSLALYDQGRFEDADAVAEAAVGLDPSGPQAIRLLATGRARALARLGGSYAHARAERMLDEAIELSERRRDGLPTGFPPCVSFGPYSTARTLASAVSVHVSIGDADRALEYASTIDAMVRSSGSRWTEALVGLDVAKALLADDVRQAMGLGCRALELTRPVPIRSVWQRARDLEAAAAPWAEETHAARYSALLREWCRTPLARPVVDG
ncbi:helix-turn-helix transcriptional regulator [Actinomadura rupiterrae]|uniref:helix-turn-helix transcriptional regulator n=1 Tax=Actinomadura rupiterrae TaxID=559627 RepID=UPI0020A48676|nr:helix-turn-helix transcriptional regulator [Actinomadura rupiterrae]MCP2336915.1 transcriptional regulator with XRE-family HTH domain [Actinomadura rupiterrae]